MAGFVIDDILWCSAPIDEAILLAGFEFFARQLTTISERNESITWHNTGFETERIGKMSFLDFLFSNDSPLPRDLRLELTSRLEKIPTFDESAANVIEVEFGDGSKHVAPSTAWAVKSVASGEMSGCLTPKFSNRNGSLQVKLSGDEGEFVDLHFVSSEEEHVGLFRAAMTFERTDEVAFAELSRSSFPTLLFIDGVFKGLRDLSQPFISRRDELIRHFSILNDYGAAIFSEMTHNKIVRLFRERGLLISTENLETKRDRLCRTSRERTVLGEIFFFDWHLKIEAHIDRIYIHPGKANSSSQIIVGIIHKHLPLPGD